jgi:hypothetical protein
MLKSDKYCRFKNKENSKSAPLNYLISRSLHNVVWKLDYEQQTVISSQQNVQSLLMCSKYLLRKCRMWVLYVHRLNLYIFLSSSAILYWFSLLFRQKSVFKSVYYNRGVLSPCKSSHKIYLNSERVYGPFKCKKHFPAAWLKDNHNNTYTRSPVPPSYQQWRRAILASFYLCNLLSGPEALPLR